MGDVIVKVTREPVVVNVNAFRGINRIYADSSFGGDGTVNNPLSIIGGAVYADGTTITGDGTQLNPLVAVGGGGGGGGTWGSITGILSNQTDLQTALNGKVDENAAITGATKTKITYDSKGLVTVGADATTADIAASTDKNYVTDAQLVVIGNTSGANSGNETASTIGSLLNGASAATPNDTDLVATVESSVLKKITWTNVKAFFKTYFDTLYPSGSGTSTGTNTGDNAANTTSNSYADGKVSDIAYDATSWDAVTGIAPSKNAVRDKIVAMDSAIALNTAKVTNATHTGEVTGSGVLTVDKTAITNKTAVTIDTADYVLISDSSDSGNLKKGLVSDLGGFDDGDFTLVASFKSLYNY